MTNRRGLGLVTCAAVAGVPVWKWLRRRRRRLALMPVGISAGAGMTMRRCRRLARLRELAAINPLRADGEESTLP